MFIRMEDHVHYVDGIYKRTGTPFKMKKTRKHLVLKCDGDNCGKEMTRRNVKKFREQEFHFCCTECMNKSTYHKEKSKSAKEERYGDKKYNNREKCKETKKENWGDPNYNNLPKAKETKLERYGDPNYVNAKQGAKTKLKKYGDDYFSRLLSDMWANRTDEDIRKIVEKTRQTKKEKGYGKNNVPIFSTKLNCNMNCRSSYEKKAIEIMDKDENIVSFIYEPFSLKYRFEQKNRNYFPDLLVEYKSGIKKLVEIKPLRLTDDPKVVAKTKAAIEYCKKNNLIFEIWTEKDLGI